MGQLDRIADARRDVQQAAILRWQAREGVRALHERQLAAGGPGAADTPQRNTRMQVRESTFARARELRRLGTLPVGIERRMGPTLDYVPGAPSEAARTAGRPVARLVTLAGPGVLPEGFATGFLVAPGLLITNHHVFPTRTDAAGTGANFLYERSEHGQELGSVFELQPDRFFVADAELDFALVGVAPRSTDGRTLDDLGVLALVEATPKVLIGQPIHIIQYPEGGPKQYAFTQDRLLDILEAGFLLYETDTLEGSSGSPAFSENWELVALHHVSVPEMRDGRIVAVGGGFWESGMPDDQVRWIANEGVRVSAIVKRLAGMTLPDPAQRAILQDLLATTTDPADELMRPGAPGMEALAPTLPAPATPGAPMPPIQFTFTGPVTIHIHSGAQVPLPAAAGGLGAGPPTAPEAAIRFDPDYASREGYDPAFLGAGLRVPAPGLSAARRAEALAGPDGAPLVLRYHHFELAMNAPRRLQAWSAANVDYDPARRSTLGRAGFGRDRWVPDPRIPAAAQILDAEFYQPAGNIDRGHIVRREDNAWGDTPQEIEFANSDTFHWTNCTPQHERFNQAGFRGMTGLWGELEQHIQQALEGGSTRACLLAGPVLDPADPAADFGSGPVQYPLRFWKVVAVPAARAGLRVFGFVLSQKPEVDRFGIEAFGPGKFRRYQLPLREIEALAGVGFDPALHKADTMAGARSAIRLDRLDQVRGLPGRAARDASEMAPLP